MEIAGRRAESGTIPQNCLKPAQWKPEDELKAGQSL
jgi:hypothetical protein